MTDDYPDIPKDLRVVAAAIKSDGVVYHVDPPGRHYHVIEKNDPRSGARHRRRPRLSPERWPLRLRHAAERVARASGQLKGPLHGSILTTEDLW